MYSFPPPLLLYPPHSYHTSSSAHLGVPCLRTRISAYHTKSFARLGVSRLRPIIMISKPAILITSVSYCVTFSPHLLLLLASYDIPARADQICFSVAYWRHQASLLCPPPVYPFSLAHTSNSGRSATHFATFACRLPM